MNCRYLKQEKLLLIIHDNGELYFRLEPLGVSIYPFDTQKQKYIFSGPQTKE